MADQEELSVALGLVGKLSARRGEDGWWGIYISNATRPIAYGLTEDIANLIVVAPDMAVAMGKIARGRADCGRPLGGETSRQMARNALGNIGWPPQRRTGSASQEACTTTQFQADPVRSVLGTESASVQTKGE